MSTFPIIHSTDLERSLRFYREELGFALTFRFPATGAPDYLYLVREGSGLGLGKPDGTAHGLPVGAGLPATFSLCIYVADVDELLRASPGPRRENSGRAC